MRRSLCPVLLLVFALPAWAALDLNKASEAELDALPGVGPARARAIVEYRVAHGPFGSVDDLGKVKGIGARTLAGLTPLLVVQVQPEGAAGPARSPVTPDMPSPSNAGASGISWMWMLAAAIIVMFAVIAVLRARRAASPGSLSPAATVEPAGAAKSSAPAAGAPSSPPPRPAGSVPTPAGAASAAPPKPAGDPPKPAGQR
ncbi:ComEA family DNA-binding protein [Methyloversatilis thermotolerans]|uniref:ComEA family DNA-binding protein n=1 Tax=Methyloversatilis thermotolerans TaxID=1346290 RepID=UPI0003716E02|nr:ComEA family DNA-binding protein [Methyloversatilis thermotolerans]